MKGGYAVVFRLKDQPVNNLYYLYFESDDMAAVGAEFARDFYAHRLIDQLEYGRYISITARDFLEELYLKNPRYTMHEFSIIFDWILK